jgi:hypothetical protein
LGVSVAGDPPVIEVKPMIPGFTFMPVPLRLLEPVHPHGVKEPVIIIAGEHLGKEAVVVATGEGLWSLAPLDHPSCTLYTLPHEHLVVCSKLRPWKV